MKDTTRTIIEKNIEFYGKVLKETREQLENEVKKKESAGIFHAFLSTKAILTADFVETLRFILDEEDGK